MNLCKAKRKNKKELSEDERRVDGIPLKIKDKISLGEPITLKNISKLSVYSELEKRTILQIQSI